MVELVNSQAALASTRNAVPVSPSPVAAIAAELLPMVRGGECLLWIGSGPSIQAGYEGWGETVSLLCADCEIPFDGQTDPESLLQSAERCKKANKPKYEARLASLFGERRGVTNPLYNYLIKLPFSGFITTNFDPLLYEAVLLNDGPILTPERRIFKYPNPFRISTLHDRPAPVFYVHGLARREGEPNGQDLILCNSDFDDAYDGFTGIFLRAVFVERPLIIVGARLEEDHLTESLRRIQTLYDGRGDMPRKIAVLPVRWSRSDVKQQGKLETQRDHEGEQQEEAQLKGLGVEAIRYFAEDQKPHIELEDVFKTLFRLTLEPSIPD